MEDENAPIDINIFYDFAGKTEEEGKEFTCYFIEQARENIRDLNVHKDDIELEEWSQIAHRYKGMAAFVGATHLYDLCYEAQNLDKKESIFRHDLLKKIITESGDVEVFLRKRFNVGDA